MKIDLTRSTPKRGFLQYGDEYNWEVSRTDSELVVERCNKNHKPFFNRYRKASFLGLIAYWELVSWWVVTRGDEE